MIQSYDYIQNVTKEYPLLADVCGRQHCVYDDLRLVLPPKVLVSMIPRPRAVHSISWVRPKTFKMVVVAACLALFRDLHQPSLENRFVYSRSVKLLHFLLAGNLFWLHLFHQLGCPQGWKHPVYKSPKTCRKPQWTNKL